MADIIIGSARHDENGKYVGGKVGDQKQKIASDGLDHSGEVSVQKFYEHKKGWRVLRPKSVDLANGLAFCMVVACNNANLGYNQYQNVKVLKDGITSKIPTNCDCSKLVEACIEQCGYKVPSFTTANEADVLLATGLFIEVPYTGPSCLCNGDILVTKTKGHTVIVVSGAKARSNVKSVNPYKEPTKSVTSVSNAKDKKISSYISSGEGVKWVQFELYEISTDFKKAIDASGGIDGKCGDTTMFLIACAQNLYGLKVDGVCGKDTRTVLKGH
jgi:hypothetical protein